MQLRFAKMHALGNDFMVARWPADQPSPSPDLVRRWADRHLGVGFDQLLLLEGSAPAGSDAAYRVFNADGREAEQCGNGARCIARFLRPGGGDAELSLASAGGAIAARLLPDGYVSVNLGEPNFSPAALPFLTDAPAARYRLELAAGPVEFGAVSLGNPHAVILVDSVETAPVGILGPELAAHSAFPSGVNVGFMQIESERRIRLRVFERGVGETCACGTGAAAAVAVGRHWGRLSADVEVALTGGVLAVRWPGPGSALWQTGPTSWVYEGQIEL
jgi:diaminopimelate epimerase